MEKKLSSKKIAQDKIKGGENAPPHKNKRKVAPLVLEFFAKIRAKILNWLLKHNFLTGEEIFYIGGADTLPAPLDKDEEARQIALLETGDRAARQTLIEHNLRLVVYIAKKFENTKINIEDLISIGAIGLIKAVNTFKSGKNIKLATYASRCIENEILMHLRKNGAARNEVSIDEPLNVDVDGNELLLSEILGTEPDVTQKKIEDETDLELLKSAIEKLSPRERKILVMRFGLEKAAAEMTQKEVADRLGISQSYISRLEKRIMSLLQAEMRRLES